MTLPMSRPCDCDLASGEGCVQRLGKALADNTMYCRVEVPRGGRPPPATTTLGKAAAQALAAQDARVFGIGWLRVDPQGGMHRVNPAAIKVDPEKL